MINGDANIWTDQSVSHDLIITDGVVTVSGSTYSVSGQTVLIDNDILEAQEFTLTQRLSSKDQLQFGSCEANSIEFTVHENLTGLKGKVLKAYMIPNHDASKMVQLGVFKVEEDELSADRTKREVTAYDALYDIVNADVASWYNSILPNKTTTKTMAQFRASFFSHFNIDVVPTTLANDSMTIKRTIEPESYSGAKMLQMICEINGVFGTIDHQGKFKFVELSPGIEDGLFPSDILYPADDLYPQDVNHDVTYVYKNHYVDITFEDYLSEAITGVRIRQDDEDVGTTIGTSNNLYTITGNILVYGKSASEMRTIGTNALDKMKNRYYKPCVITAIGNPLHELGDPLRVSTVYRGITTYILERRLVGIQSLKDTYTARGQEKFSEELNSISNQFKQLSGKTLKIQADVDGVSVDLEDLDERESSHYTQTSGQIALKVSKGDVSSEISLEEGTVTLSGNRLIVDSTNFKLDENGDAIFGGVVSGAGITTNGVGNRIILNNGHLFAYPRSSTSSGIDLETNGLKLFNETTEHLTWIKPQVITQSFEGNQYTQISNGQIDIGKPDDPYANFVSINTGGISLSGVINAGDAITAYSFETSGGGVEIHEHSIKIDNYNVLTTNSSISGSKITGAVATATTANGVANHSVSSKDGLTASRGGGEVDSDGLISIGNTWNATSKSYADNHYQAISSSDKRIKCGIINVEEKYLNLLNNVEVKEFRFKEDEAKLQLGVIAQDVLKLMGDCEIDTDDQAIVGQREAHSSEKEFVGDDKVYTVDYHQFTSLLILAYQQLKREHEELKREVEWIKTARRQDRKIVKEILREKGVI